MGKIKTTSDKTRNKPTRNHKLNALKLFLELFLVIKETIFVHLTHSWHSKAKYTNFPV